MPEEYDIVTFVDGNPRDRAEADSIEAALVAAQTLIRDARDTGCGMPVVSIYKHERLLARFG